jgi:Fis family transcriptional regulator, factor for inversion stimulation protein
MPHKSILLLNEDPSLQPLIEQHLGSHAKVISIKDNPRTGRRKIGRQTFPLIIVEATKDWWKDMKRLHRYNGSAGNATFLVAPQELLQQHADCLKALSAAAIEKSAGPGISFKFPPSKSLNDPVLSDFVERKLRDFVKHMKTGGVRNLYSMLLAEIERPLITHILKETNGNQVRAAQLLGMNRNTLRKKIKALKVQFKRPLKSSSRT